MSVPSRLGSYLSRPSFGTQFIREHDLLFCGGVVHGVHGFILSRCVDAVEWVSPTDTAVRATRTYAVMRRESRAAHAL